VSGPRGDRWEAVFPGLRTPGRKRCLDKEADPVREAVVDRAAVWAVVEAGAAAGHWDPVVIASAPSAVRPCLTSVASPALS
jgi:hypothetical protein